MPEDYEVYTASSRAEGLAILKETEIHSSMHSNSLDFSRKSLGEGIMNTPMLETEFVCKGDDMTHQILSGHVSLLIIRLSLSL